MHLVQTFHTCIYNYELHVLQLFTSLMTSYSMVAAQQPKFLLSTGITWSTSVERNLGKRPHRRLVTPPGGKWIHPLLTPTKTIFLGPKRVSHQMTSRSVKPFLHSSSTLHSAYTLQWPVHAPFKSVPSHGGSGPHLIHDSLDPHESAPKTAS